MPLRSAEVVMTYETLGGDHNRQIIEALRAAGYDALVPEAESESHPDERRI